MHCVQDQVRRRVDFTDGKVEDAAAADRSQLVAVAQQRQPDPGLVGDGEQRAGGVLVEHPGLVDDQQISRAQPGCLRRPGVDAPGERVGGTVGQPGPGAVLAPPPAVLVGQPGSGSGGGADLGGGDLGRLQRGGYHDQPAASGLDQSAGGGQQGGLARAGRALNHDQRPVTG